MRQKMKTYYLANPDYRNSIDLEMNYKTLIEYTVLSIAPTATLQVNKHDFTILSDITTGEAIKIGKALAQTSLGSFCLSRPILFVSRKQNKKEDNNAKQ